MQVFGELTPEILHARKYSKWKAAYIHNCLKNGETPIPGPVGGDSEEKETNEGGAGGWAQPPSNVDQVQPNLPSSTVVPPPAAPQPAMVCFNDFFFIIDN
jgi:vacuolar protein sorting-associated protein VTA1